MKAIRHKRSFSPWLLAAAAILVLGLGGIIVLGAALSPGQLRDDLQEAVRRQTGRDLTVAGDVHLHLGLSPELVLDDVSLGNLSGGSRPQMLIAHRVRASLALLPLLGGDAVISALIVEQPDLLLERAADGTANWQFAAEHRALYQPRSSSGGAGGVHRIEIRALSLEGGHVDWRLANGQALAFVVEHLRIRSDGADSPMTLSFQGSERGVPVSVTASSGSLQRLRGGPVSALAGSWPLSADASAEGATLHMEGGLAHPEQGRGYQFRVRLDAPSLETLNALLPFPVLPPLVQVSATGLLTDGSQGEMRSSQLVAHASASDLSGWVPGLAVKQVSFAAPGPGQLAQVSVDGTYQNQPLRAVATAMQPDLVGAGSPVQMSAELQAAGATLSVHGTAPPALLDSGMGAQGLDLRVSLHAPDLSQLSPLVGRTLPPAHDVTVDAQLGDAGVKLRGLAVRDLTASSSLGDLAGNVTVVWSPRLDVDGTLTSRVLNIDGLVPDALRAFSSLPTNSSNAGIDQVHVADGQQTDAHDLLPLQKLRTTDANLTLTAGDMTAGARHYTDLQVHLQLQDGKLALNPLRAQIPEGGIIGGISIDASSDMPPIAITLRSPGLSADAVANFMGYPGGASGAMQVDAQLSGVGPTMSALKASLTGHLGLAMVDGQVDDSLVQGLLGAALNTAGMPSFGDGNTQVRCFAVRVDFRHGEGTVRALAADTSRLSLDGSGSIDLASDIADLHLRPRVRLGPTEIAAPVSLRGPFGQMRASLDPVMGGGRYGLAIGSTSAGSPDCALRLALARGGLTGPMPPQADQTPNTGLVIRKPKDLLKGLFH